MAEAQDIQFTENKEYTDTDNSSRSRIEGNEEKESANHYRSETPKSGESTPTPKSDEPEKNVGSVNSNADPPTNSTPEIADQPDRQQEQQQQQQQGLEQNRHAPMKPMSPFAKFRQLDRQNSAPLSPSTPKTPGKEFQFKFTDPVVQNNAVQIKERLLTWCRAKTKEYENVQLDNFSTSWSNGLAFCALLHHFRPEAFDYHSLRAENRRKNFQLAFEKADELAGIAPLLDVEDMVMMRRPDWKCVFTYVQSIYRRFKDED